MSNGTAFLEISRQLPTRRPVGERVRDWREIYNPFPNDAIRQQATRCMECGIPFCHQGCPLGNLIPEWNNLVRRDKWREAIDRLHATNNFPEFTGRLCPAPCEGSCVLGISEDPVTIKQIEVDIIDRAFAEGWVVAQPPLMRTGKRVAVVGSGPSGLAAAQQLNRAGHEVTVYERADRIGGLLRYGIPEFKMEKRVLDRRIRLMEEEGVIFRPGSNVGGELSAAELREDCDAIVLTIGSTKPRDLKAPGRELGGIHFAMEYLPLQNRRCEGDDVPDEGFISAQGKHVVIIGGGDTGADCLGTAHRQGAKSVVQFELLPAPPPKRTQDNPWPLWPNIFRTSSAHEEGGEREYCVSTKEFIGNGKVGALRATRVEVGRDATGRPTFDDVPGSEVEMPADLVLLAMGFLGPEPDNVVAQLGLELNERGNIRTDSAKMTSEAGIFAAGDAALGQSLIVWAIAEGRQVARHVDLYLMGSTELP